MINIDKINSESCFRIVLTPNRSISWAELVGFYLLTCLLALAIGLFFSVQGVWMVLPFSGLEMLVLGIGLYITSRKVYRREVITLDKQWLRIEKGSGEATARWKFNTSWVRLNRVPNARKLGSQGIEIGSHGSYVEVGDFLDVFEKDALAFQLKDCIIRV